MNKKKITLISLSVLLVAVLVIGASLAFLTDSERATNTFTVGDLDVTIDEPNWKEPEGGDPVDPEDPTGPTNPYIPGDGDDLVPGDTKVKDPTITQLKGDAYMRVIMTIKDKATGEIITDTERLDLIMQTLYYAVDANALTAGTKYSLADLAGIPMVNTTNFTANAVKSTDGNYYYDYNEIFAEGSEVVFMTNIVIPTDWNQTHLATLGEYTVSFFVEAIQAKNFEDADEAFAALDAEITAGTAQNAYGATGGVPATTVAP